MNVFYVWVQKLNAKTSTCCRRSHYLLLFVSFCCTLLAASVVVVHNRNFAQLSHWTASHSCANKIPTQIMKYMPSTFATVTQHAYHFVSYNFMRIPFSDMFAIKMLTHFDCLNTICNISNYTLMPLRSIAVRTYRIHRLDRLINNGYIDNFLPSRLLQLAYYLLMIYMLTELPQTSLPTLVCAYYRNCQWINEKLN